MKQEKQITIRLDKHTYNVIQEISECLNLTKSQYLRLILMAVLKGYKTKEEQDYENNKNNINN